MTSPGRAGRTRRGVTMIARSGLVLLIGRAAEQRAQHRHVAEPGKLLDRVLAAALEQAADHEALAVAQLDRGRSAAHDQRRDREAGDRHRMADVELADLGLDLEVDQAAAQHGRREGEADAIALVVDRDLCRARPAPAPGTRRRRGSSPCRPTAPRGCGSASERATPFCSSALMIMSISMPPASILLTITPNGAVPSTPATVTGEMVTAAGVTFGPPRRYTGLMKTGCRCRCCVTGS